MDNEAIATKLAEHDATLKAHADKMDNIEDKMDRLEALTLSVQKLAFSVESMAKEQAEMSKKQDEDRDKQNELAKRLLDVEQAPTKEKAQKYDSNIQYIVQLVLSACVGAILVYLGFGK